MKIVFMGTPDFAVASLQKLLEAGHDILAVVTVPDKPKGRGRVLQYSAVKKKALADNIPVLQPDKLKDEKFIHDLRQLDADLFVVVAFRILPKVVFTIPPLGTLNVHASLLPKYRGAAPINWAIINGEKESGVTTMIIDEKVDTGGILLQKPVSIAEDMTAGELHDILAGEGSELLIKSINGLVKKQITLKEQSHELATRAPKITKEICHINFSQPVEVVYNHIRGLSPYPAAYCYLDNQILKFFKAKISNKEIINESPGTILHISKNNFTIACNPGIIEIFEVQQQGKRRLRVADFLNGHKLRRGEILN